MEGNLTSEEEDKQPWDWQIPQGSQSNALKTFLWKRRRNHDENGPTY